MKTAIQIISDEFKKSKDVDVFIEYLKNKGFALIGGGATREVYGNGKLVIKLGDTFDNKKEFKNYKTLSKHPIWKYAVVPMYKIVYNKNIENKNTSICYCDSIIIAAYAKSIKIKNDHNSTHPKEKFRDKGFIIENKKYHKQSIVLHNAFNDLHDDNIKEFGKSIVVIDLDCETGNNCKCPKYSQQFKKCIDFELHKKLWKQKKNQIEKLMI